MPINTYMIIEKYVAILVSLKHIPCKSIKLPINIASTFNSELARDVSMDHQQMILTGRQKEKEGRA